MLRRVIFADRAEAGRMLAEKLAGKLGARGLEAPLVLALPRGGVPVGAEIARALGAPLDIVLVRKIGAPDQPELAVGAVADGTDPEIVLNAEVVEELALDEDYITAAAAREIAVIERRRREWAPVRPGIAPAGRTVIVVDDGVATGMTMQAALRQLRRMQPAYLIAAAPVASREAVAMLARESDEVVCLSTPRRFGSVGAFYRSFLQVSDNEVSELLRRRPRRPAVDAAASPGAGISRCPAHLPTPGNSRSLRGACGETKFVLSLSTVVPPRADGDDGRRKSESSDRSRPRMEAAASISSSGPTAPSASRNTAATARTAAVGFPSAITLPVSMRRRTLR